MWLRASPCEGHQPLRGPPTGTGKSLGLARLASDAVTSLASIAPYATVNWGLPSALQMPMGDAGRKCFGDVLGVVIQSRCLRGSPSKKLDISQDFAQWQALPLEKRQTVSNLKTQTRKEAKKKTEKQAFFRQEMAATVCQPPFAISSCAVWLAAVIPSPAGRHAIMRRRVRYEADRKGSEAVSSPGKARTRLEFGPQSAVFLLVCSKLGGVYVFVDHWRCRLSDWLDRASD